MCILYNGVSFVFSNYNTYHKISKNSDTRKIAVITEIWTMFCHTVLCPNDADGMANSVDPDQTAPPGAVWSGSTIFAQTENLGPLRYHQPCMLQ